MKPINRTLIYASLAAVATTASLAMLAAAYLFVSYASRLPLQIVTPGW